MSYRPAPAQYRRCSPPSWPATRSGLSVGLLRRDSAERRLQPSRVIGGDGVRDEGFVHKASTYRSDRTEGGREAFGIRARRNGGDGSSVGGVNELRRQGTAAMLLVRYEEGSDEKYGSAEL